MVEEPRPRVLVQLDRAVAEVVAVRELRLPSLPAM